MAKVAAGQRLGPAGNGDSNPFRTQETDTCDHDRSGALLSTRWQRVDAEIVKHGCCAVRSTSRTQSHRNPVAEAEWILGLCASSISWLAPRQEHCSAPLATMSHDIFSMRFWASVSNASVLLKASLSSTTCRLLVPALRSALSSLLVCVNNMHRGASISNARLHRSFHQHEISATRSSNCSKGFFRDDPLPR